LVAARSQQGGIGPAYGAGGVNTAGGQTQGAYKNLTSSIFLPSNADSEAFKQIGSALQNKDFTSNLSTTLKSLFGGSGGTTGTVDGLKVSTAQQYPYYNPPRSSEDQQFD
jgi:hypothetical protein